MSHAPNSLAEAVGRIQAHARGLLTFQVIRRDDVPAMIAAATGGDAEAMQLLHQVNSLLIRIVSAPADTPMECGCCGTPLANGRFAFVIASPDIADPEGGLGLAICRRCGTTLGSIKAAAVRALKMIWPEARPVAIHRTAGHA